MGLGTHLRALRAGLVAIALCIGAVPVGASATTPSSALTSPDSNATSTWTGRVRVYAGDGPGVTRTRVTLRTPAGTYDLVLGRLATPRSGSTVTASGVLVGDTTIDVSRLDTLRTPAGRPVGARRSVRSTKVLVMRVYWTSKPPANPTTSATKTAILSKSQAWFREVSGGRYTVTGSVTPWLKIKRPGSCSSPDVQLMNHAKAKAQSKGYHLASYRRFIAYLPCSDGWLSGFGSLPGPYVWLFGTTGLSTVAHEQGHNLGLDHANLRSCRHGGATTSFIGTCNVVEYADPFDIMGNQSAGHYSAEAKARLGWLGSSATLTGSGTRTLSPYEGSGGLKAIRVKVSKTLSYWLEYRTKQGYDASYHHPDAYGVQVRSSTNRTTQLIDAMPQSGSGDTATSFYGEADRSRLAPGSSITTPEGIRIKTISQTATAAAVQVTFHAGAARPPAAPGPVAAVPAESGASVSWHASEDHGAVITKYLVTASPSGASRTVSSPGGLVTSTSLSGLTPNVLQTISVRAVNDAGTSPAGTTSVTPFTLKPSGSITSPAAGASVVGQIDVTATATPNPETGSPISKVTLLVDGFEEGTDTSAPYSLPWSSQQAGPGQHTLAVRVTAQDSQVFTSAPRTVTVVLPTLVITSPVSGATLPRLSTVTYTYNLPGWSFESISAEIDYNQVGFSATVNGSLAIDTAAVPVNGTYTLDLNAYDPVRGYATGHVSVKVANPSRSVSISSPASGATVGGTVTVGYAGSPTSWPWVYAEALVDGESTGFTAYGSPLTFPTTTMSSGSHTLAVRLTDNFGATVASAPRSFIVANAARTISITTSNAASLSGTVALAYALTPTAADWPWSSVYLVDDTDTLLGSADAPGNPIQWGTTFVPNGTIKVKVVGYDDLSVYESPLVTFTIDNPAP